MQPVISIRDLTKTYAGGFEALKSVSLDISKGEIFGLLGPNGAGKTTMINIVCGIVTKTSGTVTVNGHDNESNFRAARGCIGLVPQELPTETFETPYNVCRFSRGLLGLSRLSGERGRVFDLLVALLHGDLGEADRAHLRLEQLLPGLRRPRRPTRT